MSDIIYGKCGMRCDICLIYRPNVEKEDRRKEICEVFYKIYGTRSDPDTIICDGCCLPSKESCKVRACATEKGLELCGWCDEYPCAIFPSERSQEETTKNIEELKKWTWEEEALMEAYKCRKHMDEFRQHHGLDK